MLYLVEFELNIKNKITEHVVLVECDNIDKALYIAKHKIEDILESKYGRNFIIIHWKAKVLNKLSFYNEKMLYTTLNISDIETEDKKIQIFIGTYNGTNVELENIGFLVLDNFNRDKCFEICNWSAFSNLKPENLFSDIASCSTEVTFLDPTTGLYHIPLSIGWRIAKSKEEVINIFTNNNLLFTRLKAIYEAEENRK